MSVLQAKKKEQQLIRSNKRLSKEMEKLKKCLPPGIDIIFYKNNHRHFIAIIDGPQDTPYKGGTFKFELFCTWQYPLKPPKVLCLTKIFHPNIDKLGRICLDVLKWKWTPALNIVRLCVSLQLLLQDPNPDSYYALDWEISDVWTKNIKAAHKTAREWTKKYAMND